MGHMPHLKAITDTGNNYNLGPRLINICTLRLQWGQPPELSAAFLNRFSFLLTKKEEGITIGWMTSWTLGGWLIFSAMIVLYLSETQGQWHPSGLMIPHQPFLWFLLGHWWNACMRIWTSVAQLFAKPCLPTSLFTFPSTDHSGMCLFRPFILTADLNSKP